MPDLDRVHLASFCQRIPDRPDRTARELVDFFAYFLQVELGKSSVRTADVLECFRLSDLPVPNWVAAYLTNSTKAKPPGYVKANLGYRLHADRREHISKDLGTKPEIVQISTPLANISSKLTEPGQKAFLEEAIACHVAGCNRATIVLFWSFILDHLYRVVLKHHLESFNAKLAAHPDKKINGIVVAKRDDFGDIPEVRFVEILRSSGIVTNDVRKILDQKLGIRNTAAHPSTVSFKANKVNDFLDDLIDNVYLKYTM